MMRKVYFEKEEMDLLKLKHALADREAAFQQKQEESAVNSVNYSRRDDSIVTPPHAPGGQNPQNVLGSTKTTPPPGHAHTSAPDDRAGQKKPPNDDDTLLESYGEDFDPFASPEEQHSLNLEETEAKKFKYIGYFYKGDPMEDLDYPDLPPPEECSHFTGRYVDMLSRNGVDLGPTWVTYRRMLMWELPANCDRRSSHWLGARYANGDIVQKLPNEGQPRRSVMIPGNASQWYRGDPVDARLDSYEDPKPPRIPTCPGDMFEGESIGSSPNIFNTGQMNRSLTPRFVVGPANLAARFEPDEPDNRVRVKTPFGSYTLPGPAAGVNSDDGSDSSKDAMSKNMMVRRKNSPFIPPSARFMKGGADPVDPRRVKTDRELFSEAIASFKCKVDFKEYKPFKKDIEWIQWWSNFRINMASQGLNPVLNPEYTPGDTAEGIGFSRMQATAFGILKKYVRTNMGRAIVRNHQDNLDARAAIAELVAYYRHSTRAVAMGHALLQELLTMKLKRDMPISRGDFVTKYGEAMYNYLEHTHGREEAQVSSSQLLTYLQEAVSLDSELNRLRLDQMLRMSQGKTIMVLSQYLDALDNIAALADKATPRKGAPIEGSGKGSGGGRHVNWSEFGAGSDGDDGSDGSISVDGFTEDEVVHYLVHKMGFKKQLGFISGEKWTKLSAECRKYLRDMPLDLQNELCESLASEMRGEGGTIEANTANTSGQAPDEDTGNTDDDPPTDGGLMVLEAVRDLAKKKKSADQSKKAGSTRKDAHPGDNRGMMSQNKGKRNGKRSGYMAQRSVPTAVMAQGGDLTEPERSAPAQATRNSLGLSEDLFGNADNCPDTTAPLLDRTHQECATLTVITAGLIQQNSSIGEPPKRDIAAALKSLADKSAASRGLNIPTPVSRYEGWGHTEAYCAYCRQRGYTEEYCADCYDLNHRDEDGDTVTSVRSDPPSPRNDVPERSAMTVAQAAAPSAYDADDDRRRRYLAKKARRRAYYDKHYLPPSQCRIEDIEFDSRSYHSRDSEDTETSKPTPPIPEVSIYQVTATDHEDFHDEEWGAVEFADERPYEDYDEGISEDGDEARLDGKVDETDFHRGD